MIEAAASRATTSGGVAVAPEVIAGMIEDTLEDDAPLLVRDVELMRRLYRSGESEYLIDGEMCRLRDVQDLLMDAGVGVKAYAVIEQGKIGQILSARPTDRRQLIEEAAGVTKYKSRRRAAELKLEAAQQNLTRVDDIVFEVEKQRGTLKRQAAKARRYKRLREELRRWEKVQFADKYRRARTGHRDGAHRAGRRARARDGGRGQALRARDDARTAAPRAHGGRRPGHRRARGRARDRDGDRPAAAADCLRPPADRAADDGGGRDRDAKCGRSTPGRSRPASSSTRAATRPSAPAPSATPRPRPSPPKKPRTSRRSSRSKDWRPTSRRPAARCSPR